MTKTNTRNETDTLPFIDTEVSFKVRSKGLNETKTGILLAYIPKGKTLETALKSSKHDFSNIGKTDKVRKRADVAIVLVNSNGEQKYFTPRIQACIFPEPKPAS